MSLYRSGKDLINQFYALVKSTQIYDLKNDVVLATADKFVGHIGKILTNAPQVEFIRYRDYIFFNKLRMRFEIEGYASLQFMNESYKRLKIKSITFLPGVTPDEIIRFAALFRENHERMLMSMAAGDIKSVTVQFAGPEEVIPDFLQNGEQTKRTYFKALKVTKNLIQNLWTNQPVNVKSFRRVVYTLIDNISQDEYGVIALTTIKNFDEYTFNHSLNVGILALAMGQRLGFDKKNLVKLGTAGLLHDIGKVEISKEILYKTGKLSDTEWNRMKLHSLFSVRQILKTRGLDEVSISALVTAYQHHWNFNGTGYPTSDQTKITPSFLSRIIRICDAYDAMTTPRPYQPVPYIPALAIRVIWERKGTFFDPDLVKIFVQLFGLYPVGSCLELSSGEIAITLKENTGHIDRPIIKVVVDRHREPVDGALIDLSVTAGIDINRAVYPQKYRINAAAYLT
jgi:HD-GYP domain-containing protein (c-di-GMP phosphodiesterase class II)